MLSDNNIFLKLNFSLLVDMIPLELVQKQLPVSKKSTCSTENVGQLSQDAKEELERQAYRLVGGHSAVKTCGWTKNMLKGEGGCYKLKFYGIMSHQCMQMTTSISCANRCTFCWRGYKAPVSKEWKWGVDEPEYILEESMKAHHKLLTGFKAHPTGNKKMYEQSQDIKHVALSLTGEPITYPKINELIRLFNKRGVSTFLVTNAQYPEQVRNLEPVTQLYESVDAPNKELLKTVDNPLFSDYWERYIQSLDALAQKNQRTCIRLTLIKGINDVDLEGYASLIHRGSPDFLEVKAYMFVGASQERLKKENMPTHEEVVAFTQQLLKHLPEYSIVTDHVPSRVVILAKKTFFINGAWNTWIDFPKYHELVNSGKDFTTMEYLKRTPTTGLTGTTTQEYFEEYKKKKQQKKEKKAQEKTLFVDEKTDEMTFWK